MPVYLCVYLYVGVLCMCVCVPRVLFKIERYTETVGKGLIFSFRKLTLLQLLLLLLKVTCNSGRISAEVFG